VAIQNNLNAQLKALQDKAGPDPDEAKQKELLASQQKARQLFNDEIQKARQAEQAVMKRRNDAFSALRAQIEPIAGQIARDKKISVVIVRSGAVLWWDDSVDLTEAVLDQVNSLRKAGSFTVATQPAE